MRKLLAVCFLCVAIPSLGQVLWFEDFEAEANGVQTGTASGTIGGNWTATYGGAGTFSKQNPLGFNLFQATNTLTEGVWNMNAPISIAGTGRAIIEVTVVGFLVAPGDYFRAYYRLDGGPEVLFFEQNGAFLSFTLTGSAIVTGGIRNRIRSRGIRIRVRNRGFGVDRHPIDLDRVVVAPEPSILLGKRRRLGSKIAGCLQF